MSPDQMVTILSRAKVVPVLRGESGQKAYATAQRLLADGLTVVELTATTPTGAPPWFACATIIHMRRSAWVPS